MERKLVAVRQVMAVDPIENADAIERIMIDGWYVVSQKGIHSVGDYVFYFEIDSFLPTDRPEFDFLKAKPDGKKTVFNGIEGHRLRTIRLRKQLSQGFILSFKHVEGDLPFNGQITDEVLATDFSEFFGVQKWDKPLPAELAGTVKSTFPTHLIPKTDQERFQNLIGILVKRIEADPSETYEVTQKLDGSSMTVYAVGGEIGVCSRNLDLLEDENNSFWRVAKEDGIISFLSEIIGDFALQGELVGPGVQEGVEGVKDKNMYVFDIYNIDQKRYLTPVERRELLPKYIKHVPVIDMNYSLPYNVDKDGMSVDRNHLLETLLAKANVRNLSNTKAGEGIVLKSNKDPSFSFKVISNAYLEKEK